MKVCEGLSIGFLIRKKGKADGDLLPVHARITLHGQRAEIAIGIRVLEEQWDRENCRVKVDSRDAVFANSLITETKTKLERLYFMLTGQYEFVSAPMLKLMYKGKLPDAHAGRKGTMTFLAAIDFELGKLNEKLEIGLRAPATIVKWETFRGKMSAYIRHRYDKPDIPLGDIRVDFGKDVLHYLMTVHALGQNTAMKYIRNARQVLNTAVGRWITANPIDNFRCTYEQPEREVLSMHEIKRIIARELHGQLDRVRDVFLFSCFTGLAYSEVYHLSPSDIFAGDDGSLWIRIIRRKTGSPVELPLLPIPEAIIGKYRGDAGQPGDKALPVYTNIKYNYSLKELAASCGIDKILTSHMARHTFATTVTLEHDVPVETVSRMLGHRNLVTTQIYAKVSRVKMSRDMLALREKLTGFSGLRVTHSGSEDRNPELE